MNYAQLARNAKNSTLEFQNDLLERYWSRYSFSDKEGSRRFEEFLKDAKSQGAEVPADIKDRITRDGWASVFPGGKNFGSSKAKLVGDEHGRNGRLAAEFLHTKGNPNVLVDINKITRTGVRKSGGIVDDTKEILFLACFMHATELNTTDVATIEESIKAMPYAALLALFARCDTSSDIKKIANMVTSNGEGIHKAARVAVRFIQYLTAHGIKVDTRIYTAHHKSKLSEDIKAHGATASNIKKDKWCPADVFFIKKSEMSKVQKFLKMKGDTLSINATFNKLIDENILIPVSLKEDPRASMGSVALSNFQKIRSGSNWKPEEAEAKGKEILALLNDAKNLPVATIITLNQGNSRIKGKTAGSITELFADEDFIEYAHNYNTWNACYPPVLQWLIDLSKNNFTETLQRAILLSMSLSQESANFYVAKPDKAWRHPIKGTSVEVNTIEYQVNTTSVLIHFTLNQAGEATNNTIQVRSRGSKPSFVSYLGVKSFGKVIKLK